jgi:hypothetical protein
LEAVDKEYTTFLEERSVGITEILDLRKAVAEEEARKKTERMEVEREKGTEEEDKDKDAEMEPPKSADVEMDVDDHDSATIGTEGKEAEDELEKKEEPTIIPADGDDAVEY